MNKEPKPSLDLEKLAKDTYKKIEHCAVFDPWMSEHDRVAIILSALNTVRTARDTGHEAVMLQFELRMAQANEELAALSVRVARSDDEIQSVCLRQKAEIARLTDENERMRDALKFIQNNLLAWDEVVRDDTLSDSAIRGAATVRIAALYTIATDARAALKKGDPK